MDKSPWPSRTLRRIWCPVGPGTTLGELIFQKKYLLFTWCKLLMIYRYSNEIFAIFSRTLRFVDLIQSIVNYFETNRLEFKDTFPGSKYIARTSLCPILFNVQVLENAFTTPAFQSIAWTDNVYNFVRLWRKRKRKVHGLVSPMWKMPHSLLHQTPRGLEEKYENFCIASPRTQFRIAFSSTVSTTCYSHPELEFSHTFPSGLFITRFSDGLRQYLPIPASFLSLQKTGSLHFPAFV